MTAGSELRTRSLARGSPPLRGYGLWLVGWLASVLHAASSILPNSTANRLQRGAALSFVVKRTPELAVFTAGSVQRRQSGQTRWYHRCTLHIDAPPQRYYGCMRSPSAHPTDDTNDASSAGTA